MLDFYILGVIFLKINYLTELYELVNILIWRGKKITLKAKRVTTILFCVFVLFVGLILVGCGEQTNSYSITVNTASNGTILVSDNKAEEGQEITLLVSPDSGYELNQIVLSPAVNLTEKSENVYSFVMPGEDVSIMATFKLVELANFEHKISVTSSQNGSVLASDTAAEEGEEIILLITADSGYEIDKIISNPNTIINNVSDDVYSFTMPNSDITIMVTFKEKTTSQEETFGSFVVTSIERHYSDGEVYKPDMTEDNWKHTYIIFNEDQTLTIVSYINYIEPGIYVISAGYTRLQNGYYDIDISFESYGFSIQNANIKNDELKFELITSDHTDYYVLTRVQDLQLDTGMFNGTYTNQNYPDETVVVDYNNIVFNGITVDYLVGNVAIVWIEATNDVYFITIELNENGFKTTGVEYDLTTDVFYDLIEGMFVKTTE